MGGPTPGETPDLRVTFYWNARRKGWDIIARRRTGSRPLIASFADSQAPMDLASVQFLVTACRESLESQLGYGNQG